MKNRKSLVVLCEILFGIFLMAILLVAGAMADPRDPPKTSDAEPVPPLQQTDSELKKAQDKESAEGTMGLVETLHGERFEPTILQLQPGCDTSLLAQRLQEWQAEGLASPDVIWANNQLQAGIDSKLLPRLWRLRCVEEAVNGRLTETPANDSDAREQPDPELKFVLPFEEDSDPIPMPIDLQMMELPESKQETPYPPVMDEMPLVVEGTGSITGMVVSEVDSTPLQNIEISAYYFLDPDWIYAGGDYTDANGMYDAGELSAGTYQIGFYDNNGVYSREYYDDAPDQNSAIELIVADGTTVPNINAALGMGGHITGTVTVEDGGTMFELILIEAYRFNGSDWDYTGSFYADGNGNYDVGGLAAGTYRISFEELYGVSVLEFYDDAHDLNSATDIIVEAGATVSNIDATLGTGGHITGTVTAEEGGAPLPSIDVDAYRFNGSGWDYVWDDNTDASGDYDIMGLSTGTYRLKFNDYNGVYQREYFDNAPDLNSATDVNVVFGETVSGKNAALATGGHITGTVTTDDGGTPLGGIEVHLEQIDGSGWGFDGTDASGNYDFGGLSTGTYRIMFYDYFGVYLMEYYDDVPYSGMATEISVVDGATVPDINAALAAGGKITGTVTADDGGAPLPNIYVYAYRFNGSGWDIADFDYTDSNGEYDIRELSSGTYRLLFYDGNLVYSMEYYDDAANLNSATDIIVEDGATVSNIDATLGTVGHITGTVTAEDGGAPLLSIDVKALRFNGSGWNYGGDDYTDANGDYDIVGLSIGTYRLQFRDPSGVYLREYFDDAADLNTATDISVTAGAIVSGNDAILATAAHITGTVMADVGGAPLSNIDVNAYRFNGSGWDYVKDQNTNASGDYDIGGLATGIYRLRFRDPSGVYLQEYFDDAVALYMATDINVVVGEVASGNNAALATAAHITGTVTAEVGGAFLQYIEIEAYRFNGRYWIYAGNDYTDANGNYDVGGLFAGAYRIEFYDNAGVYSREYYDHAPDLISATDIKVAAGATIPDIDAALVEGTRIAGTVTADVGGAPLSNIDVNAFRFNGSYWDYVRDDYTDENGDYDIGGLSAGTYRLQFRDPIGVYAGEYYDDATTLYTGTDIDVVIGEVALGKNATLATGAHITGTVTAEVGGTLLQNIAIEAYRFNGSYWDYVRDDYTDVNGDYDIGGLSAGTYLIEFYDYDGVYLWEFYDDAHDQNSASEIIVVAGATVPNVNGDLAEAAHITGTVTAEVGGALLQNIGVRAYLFNGSDWVSVGYGNTDANGNYDVGGLQAGAYRVGFFDWNGNYLTEYYDDASSIDSAAGIVVSAAATTSNIDAELSIPPPPANDDFDPALVADPVPYQNVVETRGATTADDDPVLPCGPGNQGHGSLWYKITPGQNSLLTADTSDSQYDTVLAIWEGSRGNLSPVACDDDNGPGLTSFLENVSLASGVTYHIEIASFGSRLDVLEMGVTLVPDTGSQGSITINKSTDPTGGAGFDFTGDLGTFKLDHGQSKDFDQLAVGDYVVSESDKTGWDLDRVDCDSGNVSENANGVTIHLEDGDDIVCTFINHRLSVTADAGGPYAGIEGAPIGLDASASTNIELISLYKWDCAADGTYDKTSSSPTGSACTYEEDGIYTVKLQTVDIFSQTSNDTALVEVTANKWYVYLPVVVGP